MSKCAKAAGGNICRTESAYELMQEFSSTNLATHSEHSQLGVPTSIASVIDNYLVTEMPAIGHHKLHLEDHHIIPIRRWVSGSSPLLDSETGALRVTCIFCKESPNALKNFRCMFTLANQIWLRVNFGLWTRKAWPPPLHIDSGYIGFPITV